jgi:hypothetical protein
MNHKSTTRQPAPDAEFHPQKPCRFHPGDANFRNAEALIKRDALHLSA